MRRITIDPVTRLEGHGKIDIFVNDAGDVEQAYVQIPELRGFEELCIGRPAEEMPRITTRICGICPEAHHLASVKALDQLFDVTPTAAATRLRELLYSTFVVTDHTTHFFVLAGPDFLLDPDTPVSDRTFFGVLRQLSTTAAGQLVKLRQRNFEVIKILGGRSVHPVAGLPGGWSHPLSQDSRKEIETVARSNVELAHSCLQLFKDKVLPHPVFSSMMNAESSTDRTHSMGTVDEDNRLNLYDGQIRVVDPDGEELHRYPASRYLEFVDERVVPWSYVKFPYLKKIGWKGLVGGKDSGVYTAMPLARLNCADSMATPGAQEHFEEMFSTLGSRRTNGRFEPVHNRMANHWARLIELLYAAERMLELATHPEITDDDVRTAVTATPHEGIGSVEAPRGTLIHHYQTDERGILEQVNLIVGTTNNHAAMAMSVTKTAKALIKRGVVVTEKLLNQIEMVFRSYDPCLSCASHSYPGLGLEVRIRDSQGAVLEVLRSKKAT
jgi:F420-non-reducing hydrogenase large subunit